MKSSTLLGWCDHHRRGVGVRLLPIAALLDQDGCTARSHLLDSAIGASDCTGQIARHDGGIAIYLHLDM